MQYFDRTVGQNSVKNSILTEIVGQNFGQRNILIEILTDFGQRNILTEILTDFGQNFSQHMPRDGILFA